MSGFAETFVDVQPAVYLKRESYRSDSKGLGHVFKCRKATHQAKRHRAKKDAFINVFSIFFFVFVVVVSFQCVSCFKEKFAPTIETSTGLSSRTESLFLIFSVLMMSTLLQT